MINNYLLWFIKQLVTMKNLVNLEQSLHMLSRLKAMDNYPFISVKNTSTCQYWDRSSCLNISSPPGQGHFCLIL